MPSAKNNNYLAEDSAQTNSERIAQQLIEDVALGVLQPGERLDEAKLAERFATSRTPVREALKSLRAQQILTKGSKRGLFVANYSIDAVAQMFEAMQEIELLCAKLAARKMTLLARTRIEQAQQRCRQAAELDDRRAFIRANDDFHQAIYRATGNPHIEAMASNFRYRTSAFRARKFADQDSLMKSVELHEQIISSLLSPGSSADNSLNQLISNSYIEILETL